MMKAKTTAFDALNPSQRRAPLSHAVEGKGVAAGPMLILAGAAPARPAPWLIAPLIWC